MGNTEEVCDFVNKHKVLTAAYETIVEKSFDIEDNHKSVHQNHYTPIYNLQKMLQPLTAIQTMTDVSKVTNPITQAQSSINVMQEAIKQMQIPQITEGLKQLSSLDIAMGDAVNIIKNIKCFLQSMHSNPSGKYYRIMEIGHRK